MIDHLVSVLNSFSIRPKLSAGIGRVVSVSGLAVILVSMTTAYRAECRQSTLPDSSWLVQERYVMGTILEIQVPALKPVSQQLFTELFSIARRHDEIFSTFKPDSPVSRFNQRGRSKATLIAPPEMIELTLISQQMADQTGGAFDMTVGPLVRFWKEAVKQQQWPTADELQTVCRQIGARQIVIDHEAHTITSLAEGVELDFNGIAKGYCVDKMAETLRAAGIDRAFISFGESSIYAMGVAPDGQRWRVLVRDPQQPTRVAFKLRLSNMAIGSSASYERSGKVAGQSINHIIDPRTGMPAASDIAVTVIAPSATIADALSTALVVLPPDEGLKVLEKFPGAHAAIFYRSQGGRWQHLLSRGMERFTEGVQ